MQRHPGVLTQDEPLQRGIPLSSDQITWLALSRFLSWVLLSHRDFCLWQYPLLRNNCLVLTSSVRQGTSAFTSSVFSSNGISERGVGEEEAEEEEEEEDDEEELMIRINARRI